MPIVRWFMSLPAHRKVLLFLAGGMLTLVFDAFVAHYSWNRGSMHWNQWIPVVYGVAATVALALPAIRQFPGKLETRVLVAVGVLGLLVGNAGVYWHVLELMESLEGEEMTFKAIGQTIALAPPVFAPAAFSGVGLLLMCLKRLTGAAAAKTAMARSTETEEELDEEPGAELALAAQPIDPRHR
jgi:TRAP-type C4-dicarboxylate transport system permease small subunit